MKNRYCILKLDLALRLVLTLIIILTSANSFASGKKKINRQPTRTATSAASINQAAEKELESTAGSVVAAPTEEDTQDTDSILVGIDYPELQVVPRASERISMEAQEEKSSVVSPYWPIQASAIALLLAGSSGQGSYKVDNPSAADKSENQLATQTASLLGVVWLGTTYYISKTWSYTNAQNSLKKITGKDKKSELLRERLSEEALEKQAKLAGTLNWLSFFSNLAVSAYVAGHTKSQMPNYSVLAATLSFLPILVENRYVANFEKQLEYKRKIYAPISRLDFSWNERAKEFIPMAGLQWIF